MEAMGMPLKYIAPSDITVTIPSPIALVSGCPNPSDAETFISFILSDSGQAFLYSIDIMPSRGSYASPGTLTFHIPDEENTLVIRQDIHRSERQIGNGVFYILLPRADVLLSFSSIHVVQRECAAVILCRKDVNSLLEFVVYESDYRRGRILRSGERTCRSEYEVDTVFLKCRNLLPALHSFIGKGTEQSEVSVFHFIINFAYLDCDGVDISSARALIMSAEPPKGMCVTEIPALSARDAAAIWLLAP